MTCKLRVAISVLLCAAVVIFAGAVSAVAGNVPGDADGDGTVTLMDATLIQITLSGISAENADSLAEDAADVDGNGKIEIIDATFIQRWLDRLVVPYLIGVQPTQAPTQMPTDEEGWGSIIFQP